MAVVLALFGLGLALLVGASSAVRFRHAPDRGLWLAALMAALAAQMAANVGLATGAILESPHLAQLHVPLAFAIGPFLYLHTRARVGTTASGRLWPHVIVPCLALALLLPFYVSDAATKRALMAAAIERYPAAWRIRQALLLSHLGAYVLASWRLSRSIPASSEVFLWSRRLAGAGLIVWIAAAFRFVVAYNAATAPYAMAISTMALATVIVAGLATPLTVRRRPRHAPPPVSQEETDCLERVLHQLRDEHLYRSRDLTLEKLAAAVGTTPHFLSAVVNARCGTTVPELVNRFRVEAARAMLSDPAHAHRPVHEVAEAVGFTSRSAFNAAFKRHAGATPRAFRRKA